MLFLPLEALYPECRILTREHPQLRSLSCIEDGGCHLGLNARCMEALARRLGRLFVGHATLERVVLYWEVGCGEFRGATFDRSFSSPRVRRVRAGALRHYLAAGEPFEIPRALLA